MMVPRSYFYSSPTSPNSNKYKDKDVRDVLVEESQIPRQAGRREKGNITTAPKMFTPAPSTPSKPVVIPTRSRDGGRRKSRESVVKDRRRDEQKPHDPSSTSPSVAVLVAMTSPPETVRPRQPEIRRNSLSFASRRMQIAKLQDAPRRSISSLSPQSWDMLLSPPKDSDMESGSVGSDTTLGPLSSARSLSTESMPSLDTDTESLSSASNPATPGYLSGNRLGSDRRQRSVSTSLGEDCVLDHPLLPPTSQITYYKEDSTDESSELLSPTPSPLARSTSYFKSNLTASFRKIRSAAQSFSAFTAPPTQREDYLARSLLSMDSQFTDERRPQPSTSPPDSALRRYLNPVKFSPAELHFHSHSDKTSQPAQSNCTASIQLQTYQRRNRNSDKASSPPVFTSAQQKALDAVDGLPQASSPRQREPRENSDFLRVIVLEMNMRKKGKLNDASPGRAKLWLPARQAGKGTEDSAAVEGGRVPERWVGMHA